MAATSAAMNEAEGEADRDLLEYCSNTTRQGAYDATGASSFAPIFGQVRVSRGLPLCGVGLDRHDNARPA
jgi:hypothetical protein